jgi:hypothetical protein
MSEKNDASDERVYRSKSSTRGAVMLAKKPVSAGMLSKEPFRPALAMGGAEDRDRDGVPGEAVVRGEGTVEQRAVAAVVRPGTHSRELSVLNVYTWLGSRFTENVPPFTCTSSRLMKTSLEFQM